ncbi:MAG: zinc metallopeptidase, partial [Clostridia bacterium]|nr:zinc metallopeptidase [Clostridia bacterium]
MYFVFYDDPFSLAMYVLGIVLVIASIAVQAHVTSSFNKYSKVLSSRGITGAQAAQMVLEKNGVVGCMISRVGGKLTDHYDPRSNTISLSDEVYGSSSVAAVGVAAHEAGHAVQYAKMYGPIKFRMAILPAANLGSKLAIPLAIIGLVISFLPLIYAGIALFAAVTLFQLVTLPVELDASRRAMAAINSPDMLSPEEAKGA